MGRNHPESIKAAPSGLECRNPGRVMLRGLAVGVGLLSLLAILMLVVNGGWMHLPPLNKLETLCGTVIVFCCVLIVGCCYVALFQLHAARVADRIISRFHAGETLVDWHFPDREWDAFLETTGAASEKFQRNILWLPGVATAAAMLLAVLTVQDVTNRFLAAMVIFAGGAASVWLTWTLAGRSVERQKLMMRRNPRVLIGLEGAYCGGSLHQWHGNMLTLWDAQVRPGTQAMLELTIGPTKGAQRFAAIGNTVSAASAVTGNNASFVPENQSFRKVLPIPVGQEAAADKVAQTLLSARIT